MLRTLKDSFDGYVKLTGKYRYQNFLNRYIYI